MEWTSTVIKLVRRGGNGKSFQGQPVNQINLEHLYFFTLTYSQYIIKL